jgi:hypothetical protein
MHAACAATAALPDHAHALSPHRIGMGRLAKAAAKNRIKMPCAKSIEFVKSIRIAYRVVVLCNTGFFA